MVKIIYPGTRFGKWEVIKRVPRPEGKKGGFAFYLCRCDCGHEVVVPGYRLRNGNSTKCRSCASVVKGRISGRITGRANGLLSKIHGHCSSDGVQHYTPTYETWRAMKHRCLNPKAPNYKRYGGRGILVCDRWLHDFVAFLSDMGERPDGMTIDRIDNNDNYHPGNCRWANAKAQRTNQRVRAAQVDRINEKRET